jgi:3-oxoacyl-[acyl-carrier protein] reductase
MDLGLKDKVVIVAASSAGLGKASALAFAKEGAKVIISGRDVDRLQQAKEDIDKAAATDVMAVQMDVTNAKDIESLVESVVQNYGTVDVLINNAGGPPPGYFWDIEDDEWQRAYELTVMSSVRMTKKVLPLMRKQQWGRIVNIASNTVKQPIDQLLLSNSLRLAVIGWAKTLSNQVASEGITINNACPGWTRTERVSGLMQAKAEMNKTSAEEELEAVANSIPARRLGNPEEFADLIVFLASDRASYITGTSIQIDGGTSAGFY